MADFVSTGVSGIKDLLQFLDRRSKTKDVVSNNLLRELRDNLLLLQHRNNAGVDQTVLVSALSTTAIEAAFAANFNFKSLTTAATLQQKHVINKHLQKYVGWDAKRFIYSIEGKITELKRLFTLYADMQAAPLNITLRLNNLFFQMLQFSAFVYGSRK